MAAASEPVVYEQIRGTQGVLEWGRSPAENGKSVCHPRPIGVFSEGCKSANSSFKNDIKKLHDHGLENSMTIYV